MDKEKFISLVPLKISVKEDTNCWIWPGYLKEGYGQVYYEGRQIAAHLASYRAFKGEIPNGFEVDHLCRNRACINPDHLEAVTKKDNCLRGESAAAQNARKTACLRGHEFVQLKDGKRACYACLREKYHRTKHLRKKPILSDRIFKNQS